MGKLISTAHRPSRGSFFGKELNIDWVLLFSTLAIVLTGIFMIRSTEAATGTGFFLRQSVAATIGFVGMIIAFLIPYQVYRTYAKPLYVLMILLLISVLVMGVNLRGTKGWFRLGPIYFQAVELAKLTFVLSLSAYLDQRIQWYSPQSLVTPFLLAMVPIGLILIQPDLSSSLVFFPATLIMFYVSGARTLHLAGVCLVGGITAGVPLISTYLDLIGEEIFSHPVLYFFARALKGGWPGLWLFLGVCLTLFIVWWFMRQMRVYVPSLYLWVTLFLLGLGTLGAIASEKAIKDYQRKRLVAFVNPELDRLGGGYNVRQSQIAIGSGRILGKGYGKGTQSRLGFLPSRHTDFIFSVIGEELGFLRALIVMIFYFLVIWRGFEISLVSRDRFGSLVSTGFASMFAFYAMLNLGMTMGLAPVAGVPLPMVSYGGSSVLSSMLSVGIMLSIHWRRHLLDSD